MILISTGTAISGFPSIGFLSQDLETQRKDSRMNCTVTVNVSELRQQLQTVASYARALAASCGARHAHWEEGAEKLERFAGRLSAEYGETAEPLELSEADSESYWLSVGLVSAVALAIDEERRRQELARLMHFVSASGYGASSTLAEGTARSFLPANLNAGLRSTPGKAPSARLVFKPDGRASLEISD